MKEFKVNEYITLKLEEGKTTIYVKEKMIFSYPSEDLKKFKEMLEIWIESDYTKRILTKNYFNLELELLYHLREEGDPIANSARFNYKIEMYKRWKSGNFERPKLPGQKPGDIQTMVKKNGKTYLIFKNDLPKYRKEFIINDYITLKLDDDKTNIYIKGKKFLQCFRLFLSIPQDKILDYDQIESIDEATEIYERYLYENKIMEGEDLIQDINDNLSITSEQEFWGHCSNLQAWVENNYDTRILHSNLAFPLLKKLMEVGDPLAKKIFKDEIAWRFSSGNINVMSFLINTGYLKIFNQDELDLLFKDIKYIEITKKPKQPLFSLLKGLKDLGDSKAEEVLNEKIQELIEIGDIDAIHHAVFDDSLKNIGDFEFWSLVEDPDSIIMKGIERTIKNRYEFHLPTIEILEKLLSDYDFDHIQDLYEEYIYTGLSSGNQKIFYFLMSRKSLRDYQYRIMNNSKSFWEFLSNADIKFYENLIKSLDYDGNKFNDESSSIASMANAFLKSINEIPSSYLNSIIRNIKTNSEVIYKEKILDFIQLDKSKEKQPELKDPLDLVEFRGLLISRKEVKFIMDLESILSKEMKFFETYFTGGNIGIKNNGVVELILSENNIESLPDTIENLNSIERIFLSKNNLKSLPETIGYLNSLKEITIRENKLENIPKSIGNLLNLQELELCDNELYKIPETIGNLTFLKRLWLDGNNLSSLPKTIGNLKSLKNLGLSNNRLNSLPNSIGNLYSLEILSLENNQITSLPDSIGGLVSIDYINLEDNPMKHLPESILNLKSLSELNVDTTDLDSDSYYYIQCLRDDGKNINNL